MKKIQKPGADPISISMNLDINMDQLKKELSINNDFILRTLEFEQENRIALAHIDGISDENRISTSIIQPLKEDNLSEFSTTAVMNALTTSSVKISTSWNEAIFAILSGDTAVFIQGNSQCIIVSTKGGDKRAISEPTTQTVVRGPKDCFTESIRTNTSLIRNRVRNIKLRIEGVMIGEITSTNIAVVYIDDIVEPTLLHKVQDKLKNINTDAILESGYLEQLMKTDVFSPFPIILNTERPDVVVGNILEGRIAIFTEGTPFALIVPATFVQFIQSPEDYYQPYDLTSFIRMLRYIAFFIALLAPSLYIAVTTHHQEMLPTPLVISLATQRESIPFPAVLEALIMEFTFEILREAGIRMPRAVGQAVSIVGALVIGQAAVQAGLVSAVMTIVVSVTAISSFTLPNYNIAIATRLLRFFFIILSSFIGLYGIVLGLLIMFIHMCSLESFGISYLSPITPFVADEQKDTFIRFPFQFLKKRPNSASKKNKQRMKSKLGEKNEENDN